MARARLIKPGFFTNDTLAEIEPLGRLLFAGLWTIADREGRLEDRPRRIKAELLPYDACDVEALLCDLAAHAFIERYEADGQRFIQVSAFVKHQSPHIKEPASTIPAPCLPGARPVLEPEQHRYGPADPDPVIDPVIDPDLDPVAVADRGTAPAAAAPPATAAEQELLDQVQGLRGWPANKDAAYDLRKLREWQRDYPDVNLTALVSQLDSWLAGKPKERASPQRIGNWLRIERERQEGSRNGRGTSGHSQPRSSPNGRAGGGGDIADSWERAARGEL